MKNFADRFSALFKTLLPAPFTIAVVLTVLAFLFALIFTIPADEEFGDYSLFLASEWESGLWNGSLLVFAVQMMLMLVLGHVMALTTPVDRFIGLVTSKYCHNTAAAAFTVTLCTVVVALFNWGLGLVFGAIFARKVGEYARKKGFKLNYPLIGAAGYSGLMVWHGGFSGSSLSKVAEPEHIKNIMTGLMSNDQIAALPSRIGYTETVFSNMNVTVSLVLLVAMPLFMWLLGKVSDNYEGALPEFKSRDQNSKTSISGAEKMDYSKWIGISFGLLILAVAAMKAWNHPQFSSFGFISPNWINLMLLGLGITLHQNFVNFLHAVDSAISGAAGILIQFPLYFGIMGIMKSSGMVTMMSDFFVSVSNGTTYPLFTFISAGVVNIFVPSGGGQWAIQGPIIIQAATDLGVSIPKSILAMAYGDQLTNMLQPFWALPLLGITGLKAKEILSYSALLMLLGALIFISALLIF
ncbi:MAG: short-chain fatty acids transporter [Flavobacteriales bacterium]|jgi:short-chain fatty acids transporter